VWAGSHLSNARQMKRHLVKNKEEMIDWIKQYNGKMNCYYTIYDFNFFTDKEKIESSVIKDRAFLDLDAHGSTPLSVAYADLQVLARKFLREEILFQMYFSGKGFHVIVHGEVANDIRQIQSWYRNIKHNEGYPLLSLDDSGIQTNRLRRIPNTVNLSSSDENDEPYFCIPILKEDLSNPLSYITDLAKKPRYIQSKYGHKLTKWPDVKPIEMSDIEVEAVRPIGNLPILPCLHNAIMVQNPGHYARVYLVQWYRDILTMGNRNLSLDDKKRVAKIIMDELTKIAEKDDIWLDWNANKTKNYVWGIVNKGYNAPSCYNVLIPDGYCIGKCWRYHE